MNILEGLLGPSQNYGGLLSDQDQKAAKQRAMMAMASQLMASGGWSDRPTTFGQAIGSGMQAGQQAQDQASEAAIKAALLKSQLSQKRSSKPIAVVRDGKPVYVNTEEAVGMEPYSPVQRSEAPAVLQEYAQYSKDEEAAGRKPQPYMDWYERRAKAGVGAPYQVIDFMGGRAFANRTDPTDVRQITTADQEAAGAGTVAVGKESGAGNAKRNQVFIDEGIAAADSLPTLNRAISLLDTVPTGGFDAALLQAKNLLGVTGADEAELSANMGKAVLSQLRTTFGSAFTEREGAKLDQIEANFGKSTEGNKRLLQQTRVLVERAARRGIDAARRAGDEFSASEIESAMKLTLDPGKQKTAPASSGGWSITEVK